MKKSPTYNELYNLNAELKARLEKFEDASSSKPNLVCSHTKEPVIKTTTDYRLLPDLDRSVPVFTGHESNCAAED